MNKLPYDIIEKLYYSLDYSDRINLSLSSKYFSQLLHENVKRDNNTIYTFYNFFNNKKIDDIKLLNCIIGYQNIEIIDDITAYCVLKCPKYKKFMYKKYGYVNFILSCIRYDRLDIIKSMKINKALLPKFLYESSMTNNINIFKYFIEFYNYTLDNNIIVITTSSIDIMKYIIEEKKYPKSNISIHECIIQCIINTDIISLNYICNIENILVSDISKIFTKCKYNSSIRTILNNPTPKVIDFIKYLVKCGNSIDINVFNKHNIKEIIYFDENKLLKINDTVFYSDIIYNYDILYYIIIMKGLKIPKLQQNMIYNVTGINNFFIDYINYDIFICNDDKKYILINDKRIDEIINGNYIIDKEFISYSALLFSKNIISDEDFDKVCSIINFDKINIDILFFKIFNDNIFLQILKILHKYVEIHVCYENTIDTMRLINYMNSYNFLMMNR